jgi:hypothetical protein
VVVRLLGVETGKLIKYSALALVLMISVSLSAGAKPVYVGPHTVEPEISPQPSISGLSLNSAESQEQRLIVSFDKVPNKTERERLEQDKNIEFLSYASNKGWIVKAEKSSLNKLETLETVLVADYRPEYKLGQEMMENGLMNRSLNGDGTANLSVEFFEDVTKGKQRRIIEKHGKVVEEPAFGNRWKIRTSSDSYMDLTEVGEVKRIENRRADIQALNDVSREVISANRLRQNPFNLTGNGFTASMWDTGWAGNHTDLRSKTTIGDRGACDNCKVMEHATHVAGTMLGAGHLNPDLKGVAPEADLISHEFYTTNAFAENMNESIRQNNSILSQNSYGKKITTRSEMGDYDQISEFFDHLVRENANVPRTTVVFAAGNERTQWSVDYNTTASFGSTAKNTITVGAVDDNSDMTSYSSWGPTDDGRIKPDVVADGGGSTGLIESTMPNGTSGYPYAGKPGTSMAAPAVSGAVILINQQFNRTHDRLPEPATTKGLLIHTAEDLHKEGPDYQTGWGLVNATRAVRFVKNLENDRIRRSHISSTGGEKSYSYDLTEERDIKFTLVWSDYPASAGSEDTLVNDLDLNVTGPNGERKYPWTLEGYSNPDSAASKDSEDHTNNVEQVHIENATPGTYRVEVEGNEVPHNQTFSLVATDTVQPPEVTISEPEGVLKKAWLNVSADKNVTEWKYQINDGSNTTFTPNITVNSVGGGDNNITVWARGEFDNWVSETSQFRRDIYPPQIDDLTPQNSTYLSGEFPVNMSTVDELTNVTDRNYALVQENTELETGEPNSSVDSSAYPDGNYTLELNATDYFGNTNETFLEVAFDNTPPEIMLERAQLRYKGGKEFINASARDSRSGVEKIDYRWQKNGSNQTAWRPVNTTFDTESLPEGKYNLSFRGVDTAGNINSSVKTVSYIDNSKPVSTRKLNLTESNLSKAVTREEKVVNFTEIGLNWSSPDSSLTDNLSGISHLQIEKRNRVFNQSTGEFEPVSDWSTVEVIENPGQSANHTLINVDPGKKYGFSLVAVDRAGNRNRSKVYNLSVDQSQPVLVKDSKKPLNWANQKEIVPEAGFRDISGIEAANFTVNLSTGEEKISSSISSINTRDYSLTGNRSIETDNLTYYTVTAEVEDSFGLTNSSVNWSFKTDFHPPEPAINGFSDGGAIDLDNWHKEKVKVELSCTETESESGHLESSVNRNGEIASSENSPENFTFSREGSSEYSFECRDVAGNAAEEVREIRVDSEPPEIESFSIENNSEIQSDTAIGAEITGESDGSGIDPESSEINVNGDEKLADLTNSSLALDLDLSAGESYSITGQLTDYVGNSNSFHYSFTVKSPETEEQQGGTGGSGGGSLPAAEEIEEEETNTSDQNSDDEQENSTEVTGGSNSSDSQSREGNENQTSENNIRIENISAGANSSQLTAEIEFNNPGPERNYTLNITVNGETYAEEVTVGKGETSKSVSIPSKEAETYSLNINGRRTEVSNIEENQPSALTLVIAAALAFALISGAVIYLRKESGKPEKEVKDSHGHHVEELGSKMNEKYTGEENNDEVKRKNEE